MQVPDAGTRPESQKPGWTIGGVAGKLWPTQYWRAVVPECKYGSGLGDREIGGGGFERSSFDPVGENVECIATGPRRANLPIERGTRYGEQDDSQIRINQKADAQATKRSGTEDLV